MADNTTQLMCVGLGSCVAIVLYDPKIRIGSVGHIMLPARHEAKNQENPARFADSSIEIMISKLKRHGAEPSRLKAKLYGGANMFPRLSKSSPLPIGERNVESARRELKKYHIEIVEEDLGGSVGRSIIFDPSGGTVRVKYAGERVSHV